MKFIWLETDDSIWDTRKSIITTALESGITHILDEEDPERIRRLGNISVISDKTGSDIRLIGKNSESDGTLPLPTNLEDSEDLKLVKKLKNQDQPIAAYIKIKNKKYEEFARLLSDFVDYIILANEDWEVIPLENIIADLQGKDTKVISLVKTPEDARLALKTMERGVDGILIQATEYDEIKKMSSLLNEMNNENYKLEEVTITDIKSVGLGDRVCIDLCTMMGPGEGMLVGSYSTGLFLVHSESLKSEYVASRPFRVNAGPVQSYVMGTNNKTRYLSELETGDEVLIVNDSGESEKAIVGRVKIEKRPLLLVEAEYEDITIKTLLQNAETIRLVNNEKKAVSVSELETGDKVLAFIDNNARHFGMAIEETIIEK